MPAFPYDGKPNIFGIFSLMRDYRTTLVEDQQGKNNPPHLGEA